MFGGEDSPASPAGPAQDEHLMPFVQTGLVDVTAPGSLRSEGLCFDGENLPVTCRCSSKTDRFHPHQPENKSHKILAN